MILILTNDQDEHADHVAAKLRARGAELVRFDPARFPRDAEISISYATTGRARSILRAGMRQIDLTRLSGVWYRRPVLPVAHDDLPPELRQIVEKESAAFLYDLWCSIEAPWLPAPPSRLREAQLKASQLVIAGEVGFELPPTLISNSPADVLDFYSEHDGAIVSKLAGTAFADAIATDCVRYTELVSPRDIAYASSIAYCPMIFQAYVPKRVELRITVVGRRVFAAEIHSQASNHTRHDWRRYDNYSTPHFQHELPPHVADLCVRLVERLGLAYGAIDMVLTPDGRYVFLEINPNGQYLWIEEATGLPISEAICDLLVSGAPARRAVV
jgi:hypothetical protein